MAAGSKTIKAGEAFLELSIKDGQFRRSLDRSISRLKALGASFKNIGSLGISGGGIAGLQRALTLIAGSAALAWPLKLAADMEVALAAFTALTGSADKARDILGRLQVFSGQSSFSFDTLQGAARNMLNFGVTAEQVIPLVQQLGAIAAGDADRLDRLAIAFGQTQAKGRLMAEEVRQMVNAGFNPLQEIARTTGQSMKELLVQMEAGGVSAAQTAEAFNTATSGTGRFAKILELINNTARGQFNKLAAGIKIAVLPLGQELLPAITGVLKKINEMIPGFSAIISKNAGWAKVVGVTVLAISGLLATLFSLGVAFQVIAFSAGGFLTLLGAMFSPLALIAAALVGLGVVLVKFSKLGSDAFKFLGRQFGVIAEIAKQTFEGISDALSGGDLTAATNVFWAGLHLAWLEGTSGLRSLWRDFKDIFIRVTFDMLFTVQEMWVKFSTNIERIVLDMKSSLLNLGLDFGGELNKFFKSDKEKDAIEKLTVFAMQANKILTEREIQNIQKRRSAALEALGEQRKVGEEDADARATAAIEAAKKEQAAAQLAFDSAREAARKARPGFKFEEDFQAALLGDIGNGGGSGTGPRSTFSGKLSSQIFAGGGPDKTLKDILRENKVLNRTQVKELRLLEMIAHLPGMIAGND